VNSYAQLVVQNKNSGSTSSADIIVNNDRSAGTTYYGDFGINGTTFAGGGPFGDVDGTYLYSAGGTLSLGSLNSYDVKIATNNTERVRVSAGGSVGIGTTNPLQKLHVLGNLLVAAGSSTGQHITQKAYELNSGTLSWEGSAGQLFSITNNLTSGSIFSVNDVSGIPSIDVNADGTVLVAPYGGNLGIGTTNPTSKLHVNGQITSTQANSTTTGGGQIYLNGATGNRIDFAGVGVAAPTFTTRSVGTKIVLYPNLGASQVDYAFGIDGSTFWSSVESSAASFKWYAGTTNIATLSGAGALSVSSTVTGTQLISNIATGTAPLSVTSTTVVPNLNTTYLNGYTDVQLAENLRANRNFTGGGTITVDASYNVLWSSRFIVISNGYGSNFSTVGYFDITCPTSGTITGVGGAANVTATAAGIPLAAWSAIYYILPIGSANTSVAANFRVAAYTSTLDIPSTWVLICIRNGDDSAVTFNNGIVLSASQSILSTKQATANTANTLVKRDASGNFSAGTITATLSGSSTSVANAVTFNNGGAGAVSGTTFNGSATQTISYNTVGASPLAGSSSLTTTGTVTSGTWSASFGAVSGANLTSLTAGNLSGTIPSAVLGNSTHYIGTTAILLNRASASQSLTGINIDGSSGSCSGNSATATNISNSGTVTLATATESNSIYITAPSYITDQPVKLLNFDWYGNLWSLGNIRSGATPSNGFGVYSSGTERARFTTSGLQITNSFGVGTAPSGTTGEIRATNNVTAYYSDERLKENIKPITSALSKLLTLRGVTFNSNKIAEQYGYEDKKEQVGVIAQDVEKVLPQVVVPAPFDIAQDEDGNEYSKSGENYKTVHYDKLVPLLIEAIKEQSVLINSMQNQIDELKSKIST